MAEQVQLSPIKQFIASFALILGSFIFVLDYTIANVAIPYIAGGLAASVSEGIYTITSFAVGNAIFVPMTGWLSQRFGMIRVLVLSLFFFTLFSVLCGAAPTLLSLVVFRFLQGVAAGPLLPLSQGILVLIQPPKRVNLVLAIFSMVVLTAPVFGPIVGGYFCIYWDWRWIFYINLPIGIFCTIAVAKTLMYLNKTDPTKKVDVVGFCLLFVGMTALQIFLDKGEEWDWFGSQRIWVAAILAFLGLFYLIVWSLFKKEPLLELSLLKIRNFAIVNITVFVSYLMYMGGIVLIPLWLQTQMGYNALAAGIAVSTIGLGSLIVTLPVARIVNLIGPIWPMIIGFVIIAISNEYVVYFPAGIDRYHIMLSRFVLGLGLGFWITPMLSMASLALPKDKIPSGLGIFHMVRGVSGGIGASICTTVYLRRLIHQHENLISHINVYQETGREYLKEIGSLPFANLLIDRQASVIAMNEVFHVMAIMMFLLIIVLLFAFKNHTIPKEKITIGSE